MLARLRNLARRALRSYVLFVALGVVVGLVLAPIAFSATAEPDGTVAVVPIEGSIDGSSVAATNARLRQAREDGSIDAVVLLANSGGGGASASEELYLQTKRTSAEMPVVASVDAGAASGAYYAIAPSDYIYVKPASTVGSVGVLATLPTPVEPNDVIATTGPNKLAGADKREFFYLLESLRRAFVGAVFEQRGDELTMSRAELGQARLYSGTQAVSNGMADGIGGREAAVRHAARMAGLSDYRVRLLRPDSTPQFLSRNNYLASSAPEKEMLPASRLVGEEAAPVYLMVPSHYVADAAMNRSVVAPSALDGGEGQPAPVVEGDG